MLTRKLKKLLKNKVTPAAVYDLYFRRQLKLKRQALAEFWESGQGLMEQMTVEKREYWRKRIDLVLACPDNAAIPRVTEAGQLMNGQLIMHNGLRVDPLSYYSFPMLKMLMENQGVHEPQEEKIFQEVVASLSAGPEPTMLELGSYWAFYSMWFQQEFPAAHCVMVEPDRQNLFFGKENFKLNGFRGKFFHFGIGRKINSRSNITTVDEICRREKIRFVDILHVDIQGFELDMLQGAQQLLTQKQVGYVFISTHSHELHEDCRRLLREQYHFQTVADVDLTESFSWDGILVMKAPYYAGVGRVEVSKKAKIRQ